MVTLTNSEDPDEMPPNAAFHLGLHCLLRQNQSSEKEILYLEEIITCDPSIYTWTKQYTDWTVQNFIENSIGPKRVKHTNTHSHFLTVSHLKDFFLKSYIIKKCRGFNCHFHKVLTLKELRGPRAGITTYVIAWMLQTRSLAPSLIYTVSFPFVKWYK